VIELQDQRIGLAAVNARMSPEELDEERGSHQRYETLPRLCVVDVSLSIGGVVFLLVCGSAPSTVVVELSSGTTTPREIGDRFPRLAATTSAHDITV
jgi:hypothetical protein